MVIVGMFGIPEAEPEELLEAELGKLPEGVLGEAADEPLGAEA